MMVQPLHLLASAAGALTGEEWSGVTSRVLLVQWNTTALRYGTDAGDDSDDDAGIVQMRAVAGAAGCEEDAMRVLRGRSDQACGDQTGANRG